MSTTQQQKADKPCVYCTIPEIRNRAIFKDNLVWAFPTNIPITPGHTIIAPLRCVRRLEDLTSDEQLAIFSTAKKIMAALRLAYGAEGFNSVWNQEKLAGQSVPHFHLHIIPRKEGDTGLLGYDPRSMLYRTGDREPTSEEDLLIIRDRIRASIQ